MVIKNSANVERFAGNKARAICASTTDANHLATMAHVFVRTFGYIFIQIHGPFDYGT